MACLRSCHGISIRFKFNLATHKTFILLIFKNNVSYFFPSHSDVEPQVCFGSVCCLRTPVRLSLRSQADSRTFCFRIFRQRTIIHGPISHAKSSRFRRSKTAPDHHSLTTMFDSLKMSLFETFQRTSLCQKGFIQDFLNQRARSLTETFNCEKYPKRIMNQEGSNIFSHSSYSLLVSCSSFPTAMITLLIQLVVSARLRVMAFCPMIDQHTTLLICFIHP